MARSLLSRNALPYTLVMLAGTTKFIMELGNEPSEPRIASAPEDISVTGRPYHSSLSTSSCLSSELANSAVV